MTSGRWSRLSCDIFNLPPVAALVEERARAAGLAGRLGFAGGDFLTEPLPARVLYI